MKYQLILENWQKFLKEETTLKHIGIVGDSQIKGSVGSALQDYFEGLGYKVTRIGKVGAGARGFKKLAGRLKGKTFDHVIVSSGGNDAWRQKNPKSWQKHVNNHYIPLFKQLKQLSSNVHWFGPAPNLKLKTNQQRVNFSKALQGLTKEYGISYTAMGDLWKNLESKKVPIEVGPGGAFRDSLHYHRAGADAYAKEILKRWQQSQKTNVPGPKTVTPPSPTPQELDVEPMPDISKNPTMRLEPMQEESLSELDNVSAGQPIMGSPDATSGRNMRPLQFNDDIPKNPELEESEE